MTGQKSVDSQTRIRIHSAYNNWIKHRDAFGRGVLHLTSRSSLNEKFALHLLELHMRCESCNVPSSASAAAASTATRMTAADAIRGNDDSLPSIKSSVPPAPRASLTLSQDTCVDNSPRQFGCGMDPQPRAQRKTTTTTTATTAAAPSSYSVSFTPFNPSRPRAVPRLTPIKRRSTSVLSTTINMKIIKKGDQTFYRKEDFHAGDGGSKDVIAQKRAPQPSEGDYPTFSTKEGHLTDDCRKDDSAKETELQPSSSGEGFQTFYIKEEDKEDYNWREDGGAKEMELQPSSDNCNKTFYSNEEDLDKDGRDDDVAKDPQPSSSSSDFQTFYIMKEEDLEDDIAKVMEMQPSEGDSQTFYIIEETLGDDFRDDYRAKVKEPQPSTFEGGFQNFFLKDEDLKDECS